MCTHLTTALLNFRGFFWSESLACSGFNIRQIFFFWSRYIVCIALIITQSKCWIIRIGCCRSTYGFTTLNLQKHETDARAGRMKNADHDCGRKARAPKLIFHIKGQKELAKEKDWENYNRKSVKFNRTYRFSIVEAFSPRISWAIVAPAVCCSFFERLNSHILSFFLRQFTLVAHNVQYDRLLFVSGRVRSSIFRILSNAFFVVLCWNICPNFYSVSLSSFSNIFTFYTWCFCGLLYCRSSGVFFLHWSIARICWMVILYKREHQQKLHFFSSRKVHRCGVRRARRHTRTSSWECLCNDGRWSH